MKTPITGSINEKGMFTAKNPYSLFQSQHLLFMKEHPQLLTYTPSNVLVTDEEHVEVVKQWQWKNDREQWLDVEPGQILKSDIETRQVYITIPPTEKEKPELIKGNNYILDKDFNVSSEVTLIDFGNVYATVKSSDGTGREWQTMKNRLTPIPEAQPLEGVKTAEISQPKKTPAEIWVHQYLLNEGWEQNSFGVISAEFDGGSCNLTYVIAHALEAFHAQFSTDAGGGKDIEQAAEAYLNKCVSIDGHSPYYGFIAGANWQAKQAHSTHSSSEIKNKRHE